MSHASCSLDRVWYDKYLPLLFWYASAVRQDRLFSPLVFWLHYVPPKHEPNEPYMPPKRNKMVQLCIISSKRDLEYLRYSCQYLPHNANLIVCLGIWKCQACLNGAKAKTKKYSSSKHYTPTEKIYFSNIVWFPLNTKWYVTVTRVNFVFPHLLTSWLSRTLIMIRYF